MLFIFLLLFIHQARILIIPMSLACVLAYLIEPGVQWLHKRTRIKRGWAILFIYLLIITFLIYIPVSTIAPIFAQGSNLVRNTPRYLEQLGEFFTEPIVILDGYEIPVDDLPLDQIFTSLSANLLGLVQSFGGSTITIFGNVATATLSTVGWIILILIISFYLVKDHDRLFGFIIGLTPPNYQSDLEKLTTQLGMTWHAFLRGQLVLCGVVALIVLVAATLLGLPNAASLALIAGAMELVPTFGPIFAAIPAVMLALFQTDSSWLGSLISPLWFAVLVVGIYALIYQFENYVLVPRIIGYHLKLHPLVVLLGIVAGASIAGIIGVVLAAPVMASARIILQYLYLKLTDQPPFPAGEAVLVPMETAVSDKTTSSPPPTAAATDSTSTKQNTTTI
jgi:predicted PurR-regulated permease PerM